MPIGVGPGPQASEDDQKRNGVSLWSDVPPYRLLPQPWPRSPCSPPTPPLRSLMRGIGAAMASASRSCMTNPTPASSTCVGITPRVSPPPGSTTESSPPATRFRARSSLRPSSASTGSSPPPTKRREPGAASSWPTMAGDAPLNGSAAAATGRPRSSTPARRSRTRHRRRRVPAPDRWVASRRA
jgi:hypothetical protein